MKYYIGFDVHCTTSTFAVVDSKGQCILHETVNVAENQLISVLPRNYKI